MSMRARRLPNPAFNADVPWQRFAPARGPAVNWYVRPPGDSAIVVNEGRSMKQDSRRIRRPATLAVVILLLTSATAIGQTKQEHVHQMAPGVMPFDVAKTVHIFKMTESGGVERVVVKDPGATDQIVAIQQHLRHEAASFQGGDYSDPAVLHGDRHARSHGTAKRGVAYQGFFHLAPGGGGDHI